MSTPAGPIAFSGIVRWIHEHDGFGMQFCALGARQTHAIAQFLRRAQRRGNEVTLKHRVDDL